MNDSVLECDVLVLGAGMAGLTTAGRAAEAGARVVVVERGPKIGGSAALSGGFVWTATSPGRMRLYGAGRDDLGGIVLGNYVEGFAWMRQSGVTIGRALSVLHGRGYQIDMAGYQKGCAMRVEQHGGYVVCDTEVTGLLVEDGVVVGARTRSTDGPIDVRARCTVLATGGFQNDATLRERMIHPNARSKILMRSNPHSRGDGLRLATAVGAATTLGDRGFYGHLVSESPRWGDPSLFTMLSQYHSEYALLFNEAGARFCDETLGDHVNTCATVAQPNARAILFWDARIHQAYATAPVVKGTEVMDKMTVALEHGGRGVVAETLQQVREFATAQGFDGERLVASVEAYNDGCRDGWETLSPGRADNFGAMDRPPYYALVVLPAITHTHGGIVVDARCRALRADGSVIPGLLVAGTDAGDIYGRGYAGGLALAMGTGIEAARTALAALA